MVAGRAITDHEASSFWARFGTVEHEALEFRISARRLRDVIPAMAMTEGGTVVLGVADDRRLVGCPLDQHALDAIMRRAREAGVDVEVQPIAVEGVPLTLVTVPRVADRIVTTADGRLLRRVGSDNVPVCGDDLARFVARRGAPGGLRGRLVAWMPVLAR
jgi:predicted HTH transcriptional regulator